MQHEIYGAAILALSLCLTGCGHRQTADKASTSPPPGTNQSAATAGTPLPASTQAAILPSLAQPNGEPDMGELNRTLLRWVLANRRRPASFEDFAATAGVPIPPPPAGKKYIIGKDMHVILVSR